MYYQVSKIIVGKKDITEEVKIRVYDLFIHFTIQYRNLSHTAKEI